MKINASDFKARCLALIDRVHERHEPILITKRGRIVASLVPADDDEHHPWVRLRGTAQWIGDPFAPAVDEEEIEALK